MSTDDGSKKSEKPKNLPVFDLAKELQESLVINSDVGVIARMLSTFSKSELHTLVNYSNLDFRIYPILIASGNIRIVKNLINQKNFPNQYLIPFGIRVCGVKSKQISESEKQIILTKAMQHPNSNSHTIQFFESRIAKLTRAVNRPKKIEKKRNGFAEFPRLIPDYSGSKWDRLSVDERNGVFQQLLHSISIGYSIIDTYPQIEAVIKRITKHSVWSMDFEGISDDLKNLFLLQIKILVFRKEQKEIGDLLDRIQLVEDLKPFINSQFIFSMIVKILETSTDDDEFISSTLKVLLTRSGLSLSLLRLSAHLQSNFQSEKDVQPILISKPIVKIGSARVEIEILGNHYLQTLILRIAPANVDFEENAFRAHMKLVPQTNSGLILAHAHDEGLQPSTEYNFKFYALVEEEFLQLVCGSFVTNPKLELPAKSVNSWRDADTSSRPVGWEATPWYSGGE